MKKIYSKPFISVEIMSLDEPIAANCTTSEDDIMVLNMFGIFMDNNRGIHCDPRKVLLPNGGVDENGDGLSDGHDTLCYNSNIDIAFLS